jgi:biotin operon repressor
MKKTKYYKGHRWTNEELKKLMKMWADGESVYDISDQLNCGKNAIQKMVVRLRKEGIPLERRRRGHVVGRSNKLWTQAEVEYLLRRRYEKATVEEIGMDLGRTWNAVNAMIQKLRSEDVSVPMMGQGVRRLWNPNTLKKFAVIEKNEETKIVDLDLKKQAVIAL